MTDAADPASAPPGQAGPRARRRRGGAPTIADVAREARCSPMTVSRVINGEGKVRQATREQVEAAIARLNYSPNHAARSLAAGDQSRVALLFDKPSASYLSEFLMGALEEANRSHIQLVVQACDDPARGAATIRQLAASGIAGFIVVPPLSDDPAVMALVNDLDAVAIAVSSSRPAGLLGTVEIDDVQAAHDMTSHLLRLGHRRIGFIIGNAGHVSATRRLAGYRQALADAGLAVDERLIVQGHYTYRSGLDAAEELLALAQRPSAIFASNDEMAAACVTVAHRRHLKVPEDLTVCGFDDTEIARSMWPELTTIRQPIRDMAAWAVAAAARLVKARQAGERPRPEHQTLPHVLVRRESDAPPAGRANAR